MADSENPDSDWSASLWPVIAAQSDFLEFDWFARDVEGCLAVLSSFGVGPSPAIVRVSRERFNDIQRVFTTLQEVTDAILDSPDPCTQDWQRYARKGLFAYDNGDVRSTPPRHCYDRIARPGTPIDVNALGMPTDLLVGIPVLPVVFGSSPSIQFAVIPK